MTRDISVTVFNQTFGMPIGLSPTARQKRWTSEGENTTVKGKLVIGLSFLVPLVSHLKCSRWCFQYFNDFEWSFECPA